MIFHTRFFSVDIYLPHDCQLSREFTTAESLTGIVKVRPTDKFINK